MSKCDDHNYNYLDDGSQQDDDWPCPVCKRWDCDGNCDLEDDNYYDRHEDYYYETYYDYNDGEVPCPACGKWGCDGECQPDEYWNNRLRKIEELRKLEKQTKDYMKLSEWPRV